MSILDSNLREIDVEGFLASNDPIMTDEHVVLLSVLEYDCLRYKEKDNNNVLLGQVKSQICYGIAQYDKCSPNTGCGCLHIPGAINVGVCSYEFLAECSELVKCDDNNLCDKPDHRCVHHPRCQSAPVCYPVPTYNRQLCPPIT
ncbi:unnamed protein product, partial [Rotaria magnacalcarata]